METPKTIEPENEVDLYRLFMAVTGLRANQKRLDAKSNTPKTSNVKYFETLVDRQLEQLATHFFGPGPNENVKQS